jgi:hypothetical protein
MRGVIIAVVIALAACGVELGQTEQEIGCNLPEETRCDPSAADTCTAKCATQAWCPSYDWYLIVQCSAHPGPSFYNVCFFYSDGTPQFPCTSRGTPCQLKQCQLGSPP